jgi:signal transduction histidine kinase
VESVASGRFGRHRGILGAIFITIMVGVFAVSAALRYLRPSPILGPSPAEESWLALALVAVAVLVVVAGWSASMEPAPVTLGLAIVTFGWLAPAWATSPAMPVRVQAVLLAMTPVMIAGLNWLLILGTNDDRGTGRSARAVWILTACAVAIPVFGYNPFEDPACVATCTDIQPALAQTLTTRQSIMLSTAFVLAAAIGAGLQLRRRHPARLAGMYAAALVAAASASVVRVAAWSSDWRTDVEAALTALAVSLGAGAVLAATAITRRTRRDVEELVAELSASEHAPTMKAGAPSVLFSVPDEDRWIDLSGAEASSPTAVRPGQAIDGGAIWLSLPLRGPTNGSATFAELAPATRLVLRNARLTALGRARLAEVHASRLRILLASDLERKRIERDLHDGAQQRLVSASIHLRLALGHADPVAEDNVSQADRCVQAALDQLRSLTHGVYPSALTDEGLAAALEDLVASISVPTSLDIQLRREHEINMSLTVYALVADYLAAAARSSIRDTVTVGVHDREGRLTVTFGSGLDLTGQLTDSADRVGAHGGTMTTRHYRGQVVLTAVIPCGS